jgi:thiol-disulfide isomerase/thioredoxin
MIRRFPIAAIILICGILSASAMGLKSYDAKVFSDALSDGKAIVVLVSGDDCAACPSQEKVIDGLSQEASLSHVEFMKAGFAQDKDFMTANKVLKPSVLLIFKDGKEVERLEGVTDAKVIEAKVKGSII